MLLQKSSWSVVKSLVTVLGYYKFSPGSDNLTLNFFLKIGQ